jgi:Na+-driven multidrug efflux pump
MALPNPVRLVILWIGLGLARLGLIDETRVRRTVELSWPRIVTGIARMSKNAADVAMVGIAVGPAAIGGVGFAGPYWGVAFTVGGGLAAGTIALVSQRFGAEAFDRIGQPVRSSVVLVLAVTIPLAAVLFTFPRPLIAVLSNDPEQTRLGAQYLRVVAVGVPFAGLNLVGSRVLIGADDAWTPMVLRAVCASSYILLNAVLIFPPSADSPASGRFPYRSRLAARTSTERRCATSWRSACRSSAATASGPSHDFRCCGSLA